MPYLMRTYMTDDLSTDYCLSYIGNFLIRQLISTTSSPSNSLLHIRHLSFKAAVRDHPHKSPSY